MKKSLLLLIFLLAAVAGVSAQGTAFQITAGPTGQRPTGCSIVGAATVYVDNTLHKFYICKANNTWGSGIDIDGAGGSGTVTSVSVVSANGLAGTVATATTTPAITLSTTITGLLKGNGTAISAATAGTDYVTASSTNTFTNKTYDTAGTGNSFSINGVAVTANTGTGAVARAAGPTFTTPTLGAAAATTLNGNTFTTGTYTLTGVAGKTLTFNKSITLEGTDSTTMTFPATTATIARTDAAQTFTGTQTYSGQVQISSGNIGTGTPGLAFSGATSVGLNLAGTTGFYLTSAGNTTAAMATDTGVTVRSTAGFGISSSDPSAAAPDIKFARNAAGVAEFNNGSACSTVANCRDITFRHSLANGTVPVIASGFGGSPSIAGNDEVFRVTAGAVPGTGGVVTFGTAYANAPVCTANDETTLTVIFTTTPTTTNVTITSVSGVLLAADKIGVTCRGYK